jgi:hypothetical protein
MNGCLHADVRFVERCVGDVDVEQRLPVRGDVCGGEEAGPHFFASLQVERVVVGRQTVAGRLPVIRHTVNNAAFCRRYQG